MAKKPNRAPRPLARKSIRHAQCGLCGSRTRLTKTHVPPQCAGNRGAVTRFTLQSLGRGGAAPTRKQRGGLHFQGLCEECNSKVQGRWDPAYGDLARALSPLTRGRNLIIPGGFASMPCVEFYPGAVARVVLIGAFALNPRLREVHPHVALGLLNGDPNIRLSPPLGLYMALTRGPFARATGAIGGFYVFRPKVREKNVGIMTLAQVYFPPLAWQLADGAESVLLEVEKWRPVSSWLQIPPFEPQVLSEMVSHLPFVVHPTRAAGGMKDWVEMLSDEAAFVIESDDAMPDLV